MRIKTENLSVGIQGQYILDQISLEIETNQFWLIFGRNGAGKTTLLRALSGMIPDYSGSILWGEFELNRISGKDRAKSVAYLAQEEPFSLPFLVEDVLFLGRYPYLSCFSSLSGEDWNIVNEMVSFFQLESLMKRDILSLSGGERKKVLIASAMIQDVDVLILDEPLNFLDPGSVFHLIDLFRRVHRAGKTFMIASHDVGLFFDLASHVLALKNGKVLYQGKKGAIEKLAEEVYGIPYRRLASGSREFLIAGE